MQKYAIWDTAPPSEVEEELVPKKGATSVVWNWSGFQRLDTSSHFHGDHKGGVIVVSANAHILI